MTTEETRPVALVSGGSRGIGRAAVFRLVQDGYDVAFCYQSDADAAKEVEKAAVELGGRAVSARVDVADPVAVQEWVTEVEAGLGPVQAVITSAGVVRDAPMFMMSYEDWSRVIDVNLNGIYNVCRAAITPMMKRKSGTIVNISSTVGLTGQASQTNYSASKAGIHGFTQALAKEVGRYNIRVNALAPGFIETDMTAELSKRVRDSVLASTVLGRFGTVDEAADAVMYLLSATYVTGTVLRVDGGLVM
ncbi:3-oxoacyl-ACP reductase FabG [Streptomyces sp. RerS4]|uniref:3-oxoacyl-ACP reductase FabG n=1 Tax=Streptomyces sp. RerS4 TaxID=2942449 RepID=UPI00201BFE4D|nr:3-oxoacyl-ACP reductase FabG [Streptomyces sp. RerS4]UQX03439.1 3-oxoacyl-ACP reductase FabG [Streptomyces sp. RerS4]